MGSTSFITNLHNQPTNLHSQPLPRYADYHGRFLGSHWQWNWYPSGSHLEEIMILDGLCFEIFFIFIYFHPYLGKWSNLTNNFQMVWNHQPVLDEFQRCQVPHHVFCQGMVCYGLRSLSSTNTSRCSTRFGWDGIGGRRFVEKKKWSCRVLV